MRAKVGKEHDRKAESILRKAERLLAVAEANGQAQAAKVFRYCVERYVDKRDPAYIAHLPNLARIPVTIDEFIESPEFLGGQVEVWPSLRDDLRAYNPYPYDGTPPVVEVLDGGATSTGKTTKAHITQAYQLYLTTCYRDVRLLFPGISRITPVVFLFMSVSGKVTNSVIYRPFRSLFLGMEYTQRYLTHDKNRESSLLLGNGVEVIPCLANEVSLVGQAVLSAIMDEVNYMAVVESSKRTPGPRGLGGKYDQANAVYTTLSRRRRGRFMHGTVQVGCLSVMSSTRYRGDFLDRRQAEIEAGAEKNIVLRRRAQYEVWPEERYPSGKTMRVLVGQAGQETRILKDKEPAPKDTKVLQVPIEYRADFLKDAEGALRDICGVATDAINVFIGKRSSIAEAVEAGRVRGLENYVVVANANMDLHGGLLLDPALLPDDPERERYAHVDLATSNDRAGVAICKVVGFVDIEASEGVVESVPLIAVELAVSIEAGDREEISITDIRSFLTALKLEHGVNLVQVTYDSFGSKESIQLLRKAGVKAHQLSVDKTSEPYKYLKAGLYRGTVELVDNPLLVSELSNLEYHAVKDKVDHPPTSSKDIADAVCGAVYAAGQARRVRSQVGVKSPASAGEKQGRRSAVRR